MFYDEFQAAANGAKAKVGLLRSNPLGYFLSSMLAGMYVGFGILLIFTIGGQLGGLPHVKIVMGVSFGIALSLVIMAGSELFTGNNLVMTAGMLQKTVKTTEAIKLWVVCYLGNWIGSIVLALIFVGAGLATGATGEFMTSAAAAKMSAAPWPLFLRGVLCNILVCLAVWCGFRLKSDSGKLIMIFWCLFAFITSGFEHSIANMTLLTVALLSPQEAVIAASAIAPSAVSLGGYFYNILLVTAGNMVGGLLFVALPYHLISRKKEEKSTK